MSSIVLLIIVAYGIVRLLRWVNDEEKQESFSRSQIRNERFERLRQARKNY